MNIGSVGGGPAGLSFILFLKQLDPAHRRTVIEQTLRAQPIAGASSSLSEHPPYSREEHPMTTTLILKLTFRLTQT